MQLHKDFSQPFFQYLQWPFLDSIINVPEFLHRLLQEAENGMLSTFGEVAQCKREFFRKLDSPWLLNVYSPSFLPLFTLFLGPLLVLGLSLQKASFHQFIFFLHYWNISLSPIVRFSFHHGYPVLIYFLLSSLERKYA